MKKKCSKCQQEKDLSLFHKKQTETRYNSWCKTCVYEKQKNKWKDRKRKAVELLGGQCIKCGYKKNLAAFHFHHVDAKEKEYEWSRLKLLKWDTVIKELKKCVLLCANCHAEEHSPGQNLILTDLGESNCLLNQKDIWLNPTGSCPTCKKDVYGTKYCSTQCASFGNRKVKRPSKNILAEDMKNLSWREIGKKYQVSDNAVRKWATTYGLLL